MQIMQFVGTVLEMTTRTFEDGVLTIGELNDLLAQINKAFLVMLNVDDAQLMVT